MKKANLFKIIFIMILLALSRQSEAQISRNLHIGDGRNQTATNIRVLPDNSGTIIAGYDYDINGSGQVANAQMVLMKVNNAGTTIIWQEKFGVAGANNLVYNMIITHDNDIVVVGTMGRSYVYNDNVASIMKFDGTTGALLWQNNMKNSVHTVGGEIFYAVTELGAAANYALVAVGTYDSRPTAMNSLIGMFENNTGVMIYDEMYNVDNNTSDGMYGVCTSEDGMSAYIAGAYNGDRYQSGMVFKYTPGMYAPGPYAPGTFVWKDFLDFTMPGLTVTYVNGKPVITPGSLDLNDNFFSDIYIRGSKLVIYGGSMSDYITTAGEGESITRMDAATGGSPETWQVQSSNMTYANNSKIYPLDQDHIINMQTPTTVWYDPIRWLTTGLPSAEVVLTDITSLTAPLITTTPVKYVAGSIFPSLHALIDITLAGSDLYMSGVTNDPDHGYGQNDIYFVKTPVTLGLDQTGIICDSADTTGKLSIPMIVYSHNLARFNFTPETLSVTPVVTNYRIDTLCGKILPTHHDCTNAWDTIHTKLTTVNGTDTANCSYQVVATGAPNAPFLMIGYLWNIGGTLTWDATTSTTDNKPVILPYGGSQVITVTYYATDPAGDTCTFIRTIHLTCSKPPCYDTTCTKLTVTSVTGRDSCTFTACANICTPYSVVGYDWTLNTGTSVTTHHTGAHADCFTFTIPSGASVTVSVVAHIIDYSYAAGTDPCCEADLSQKVTCQGNDHPGCVDEVQTSLTGIGTVTANGCVFTCTANVIPLPGWSITGYQWSEGGPFTTGTATHITAAIPVGSSVTVTVIITLTDQQGNLCTYTITKTFTCNNAGGGGNPGARPGGDKSNTDNGTGISIFPNPTDDAVTVSSAQSTISNIQVIDVNGKKLLDVNYTNARTANISLSNFPAGSYLFRVNNSSTKVVTKAK